MRVLITGSSGFIGRHFVRALQSHDIVKIDIADPDNPVDARDFFRSDDSYFDLVIHLAAVVGGRQKIENSPLDLAVDLSLDSELFQWALRSRPGRVIYYSSSAAYPVDIQNTGRTQLRELDINLESLRNPDMLYGWAKLTGELLAHYARSRGVKVSIFRPFSGYGEDQSLDYPFPKFIERAVTQQDPFEIWGDGEQVRDFIHVNDIVGATVVAVYLGLDGPFNLGWGRATSFNQLANMICEQAGYSPRKHHLVTNPVGVNYRVSDPSAMLSFYKPLISLEEGIARALYARRSARVGGNWHEAKDG